MKSIKFFAIAAFVVSSISVAAHADDLSCLVGVYTANDMVEDTTADPATSTQLVTIPIVNGEGQQDFTINGETVSVDAYKYEHTDLYNLSVVLMTPVADRHPRTSFVAVLSDYLYNDGPTKENGWDLKPGPNATRFAFLNRQVGTFAMTPKLMNALKAAGKWGTYPFNTTQLDVNNSFAVAEFVTEQVKAKTMQPTDVVGISTMFSCTLEK